VFWFSLISSATLDVVWAHGNVCLLVRYGFGCRHWYHVCSWPPLPGVSLLL
jgi:hypothetical protein